MPYQLGHRTGKTVTRGTHYPPGATLTPSLVSYNEKHNDANGESNRDGADDNRSWNCGAEGPTTDDGIVALRNRLMKNFACYLLFSSGTPMISLHRQRAKHGGPVCAATERL